MLEVERKSYSHILDRCNNENCKQYKWYGERGIKYEYIDFEAFIADVGERPDSCNSIDRIDNNGNYKSGNCRWADSKTQANNKRNNVLLTAFGKTQTIPQWAEETGIKANTIWNRKQRKGRKHLSDEDCLKPKREIKGYGVYHSGWNWRGRIHAGKDTIYLSPFNSKEDAEKACIEYLTGLAPTRSAN